MRTSINPGAYCECGNAKSWRSQCCRRCYQLDGAGETADLITLLRVCDTITVEQVAFETGRSRDAVLHTLSALVRRGRVRNLTPRDSPIGAPGEYILVQ